MEYWKCVQTSTYTTWHADKNAQVHLPNDLNPRVSVATQISGCIMEIPIHSCMCNRSLSSLHKLSTTRALITTFLLDADCVVETPHLSVTVTNMCVRTHIDNWQCTRRICLAMRPCRKLRIYVTQRFKFATNLGYVFNRFLLSPAKNCYEKY